MRGKGNGIKGMPYYSIDTVIPAPYKKDGQLAALHIKETLR